LFTDCFVYIDGFWLLVFLCCVRYSVVFDFVVVGCGFVI